VVAVCRCYLKYDGTRAETRFRLSAKRTSPFKSAGASVQSTVGSRGVRISGSTAGYTMFRGSEKDTGYSLISLVSPSHLSCASPCVITFQPEYTSRFNIPDFGIMPIEYLEAVCLYGSENKQGLYSSTTLTDRFL
jgi:hypothetical protein